MRRSFADVYALAVSRGFRTFEVIAKPMPHRRGHHAVMWTAIRGENQYANAVDDVPTKYVDKASFK